MAFEVLILHDSGNTGQGIVIAAGYSDMTANGLYDGTIMSVRTDADPDDVLIYESTSADVTEWDGSVYSNETKDYDPDVEFVTWDAVNDVYVKQVSPDAPLSHGFGQMYEDNASGSDLTSVNDTYDGWITATAGEVDLNGLITFNGDATADQLLASNMGQGYYEIAFEASFQNDGGNLTTAAIHLNDVEQVNIKMTETGNSSDHRSVSANGILKLDADDYIDLRFKSTDADIISLFQVSVTMHKINYIS